MNCSACNRNNVVSLSVCPGCGRMTDDSIWKEVVLKVSDAAQNTDVKLKVNKMVSNKNSELAKPNAAPRSLPDSKPVTAEMKTQITNPTLVEFHNRNAAIPEWRLQLQNVVRQRQGQGRETTEVVSNPAPAPTPKAKLITNGANALKAEIIEAPKPNGLKHPTLSSALERIEKSRRQFLQDENLPVAVAPAPAKAAKNYPFYIAGKNGDGTSKPAEINPPVSAYAKPKLAPTPRAGQPKLDTNKLPPLSDIALLAKTIESRPIVVEESKSTVKETVSTKIEIDELTVAEIAPVTETAEVVEVAEVEEYDDCAPFAMRFNAGLFDLIIGSFVSFVLLSPFMMFGGDWLSIAGVFAFLTTCAIVMFIYLTAAIGIYSRTLGMRLFSLEMIDVESEDYPTFHQAAVNSAVYILSLVFGGIGFLSIPFNEDKRAVHDLVSGTVIVKEA